MNCSKTCKNDTIPVLMSKLKLSELGYMTGGLKEFGGFEPRKRKEREGRNPKTGETG